MPKEMFERMIPLIGSAFGIGILRSLAFGFLSGIVKRAIKKVVGIVIVALCVWLFLNYWN